MQKERSKLLYLAAMIAAISPESDVINQIVEKVVNDSDKKTNENGEKI